MQFMIKEYLKDNGNEILDQYDRVGWSKDISNPSMLANAYQHSLKILGAYDIEKLVGIVRVIGDRKGIGVLLLEKILLKYKDVY